MVATCTSYLESIYRFPRRFMSPITEEIYHDSLLAAPVISIVERFFPSVLGKFGYLLGAAAFMFKERAYREDLCMLDRDYSATKCEMVFEKFLEEIFSAERLASGRGACLAAPSPHAGVSYTRHCAFFSTKITWHSAEVTLSYPGLYLATDGALFPLVNSVASYMRSLLEQSVPCQENHILFTSVVVIEVRKTRDYHLVKTLAAQMKRKEEGSFLQKNPSDIVQRWKEGRLENIEAYHLSRYLQEEVQIRSEIPDFRDVERLRRKLHISRILSLTPP